MGVKKEVLESLVGENEKTVVGEIDNESMSRLKDRSNTYLVYEGYYVEDLLHVGLVPWPIPMPVPLDKTRGTECLLLEFRDGELRRFEFDSLDSPGVVDCRRQFWSTAEIEAMEAAALDEHRAALLAKALVGDSEAALEFVGLTGDDGPLWALTEQVNSQIAYDSFSRLYHMQIPGTGAVAWQFLCKAADVGITEAQNDVAFWHRESVWSGLSSNSIAWISDAGVRADNRVSWMWYTVAAERGDQRSMVARNYIDDMTGNEIAQAEQWAKDWQPGQCPRPPSAN